MREQREIIYANRRDVITANRDLGPEIKAMIKRTIDRAVDAHARSNRKDAIDAIVTLLGPRWYQKSLLVLKSYVV